MVLLILAAIVGGSVAFSALLPYGWLVAFCGFSFGGSLAATFAAIYLSLPAPVKIPVRSYRAFRDAGVLESSEP